MHDLLQAPNDATVVVVASTISPPIDHLITPRKASVTVFLDLHKDLEALKTR